MIELTLEDFILWAIGVPLVGIAVYTVFVGLSRRSHIRAAKNQVITCRVCGHIYQDRSREKSPPCPQCGRANDRGRSRRLG